MLDDRTGKRFSATINGRDQSIHRSFYRGSAANYMPRRPEMTQRPDAISEYILKGWMPEAPFIGPQTNIVAFGSCFAVNIANHLSQLGFDVATKREGNAHVQRISDGLVNVFAILQQFEWAWEKRVPAVELWHGWKAEDFGYDEDVRLATKALFDAADVFILTFGLSEIWYDEPTGEVFWRAVPEDKFDPSRHKFRVATHAETHHCLRRIYDLIRKHRPDAKIVFTLSPVGLRATFRDVSCVTANAVSKARLRSALDQVFEEARDPAFFYFPAYEVVTSGFQMGFTEDLRHPSAHVLTLNMKAFERFFCTTGMTEKDFWACVRAAQETDSRIAQGDKAERAAILREGIKVKKRDTVKVLAVDQAARTQQKLERRQQKNDRRRERDQRIADREARRQAKGARDLEA